MPNDQTQQTAKYLATQAIKKLVQGVARDEVVRQMTEHGLTLEQAEALLNGVEEGFTPELKKAIAAATAKPSQPHAADVASGRAEAGAEAPRTQAIPAATPAPAGQGDPRRSGPATISVDQQPQSAHPHYYGRNGQQFGPISFGQLQQLAATGGLQPQDLVWRDGLPNWVPAENLQGLFPARPADPAPIQSQPQQAAIENTTASADGSRLSRLVASISSRANVWQAKARDYMHVGSQATDLEPTTFCGVAAGAASLALMLFLSMFTWYGWGRSGTEQANRFIEMWGGDLNGEWHRGISYAEGKLTFLAVVVGGVWLGLGVLKKSWLPAGSLVAGAVATFSFIVLVALRSRVAAAFAAMTQQEAHVSELGVLKAFEEAGLTAKLYGGVGWGLNFCIIATLAACVAFFVVSLRRPHSFRFFQKPEMPPLVQRYGTLAATYAVAFLAGVVFAVFRY